MFGSNNLKRFISFVIISFIYIHMNLMCLFGLGSNLREQMMMRVGIEEEGTESFEGGGVDYFQH